MRFALVGSPKSAVLVCMLARKAGRGLLQEIYACVLVLKIATVGLGVIDSAYSHTSHIRRIVSSTTL